MYMYFFLMSRGRRHFLYARADVKFIISGQNNFDSSSFTGFCETVVQYITASGAFVAFFQ